MAPIPIGQEQPIQKLQDIIYSRKRCLLMSGYDLSALASTTDGLHAPHSWQELLKEVAERARQAGYLSSKEFTTIQGLIAHQALNRAGVELESHFLGPKLRLLQDYLRELLLGRYQIKSEAHRLIVSIPFQAYIVTTLDLFIEDIYAKSTKSKREKLMKFYDISQALDFKLREKSAFILKLHGDIEHESSSYITDLDFQQRLSSKDISFKDNWQRLTVDSSILFLGFEPESPDMKCLEHFCKQKLFNSENPHWIIIPQSQEDAFRKRLIEKYSYLQIISYPEPADKGLIDFLKMLLPESRKRTSSSKRATPEPLAIVPSQMPSKSCPLVILWAKEDVFLWKKLEKQLMLLQNSGLITIWHSGETPPGDNPIEMMIRQIDNAKVILLLTSANFFLDPDLSKLIDMVTLFHEGRIKKVLNIMLSSYDRQIGSINKLPMLSGNKKVIDLLGGGDQERAFMEITQQIRQMVNELGKTSNF